MTPDDLAAIRERVAYLTYLGNFDREELYVDEMHLCALLRAYDALRAAAAKVTCQECSGRGYYTSYAREPALDIVPCPDCADLRKLLEDKP